MKKTLLFLILLTCASAMSQSSGSGKCFLMDDVNDYLTIPNDASLSPSSSITIEAWIRADSWATNIWENVIVSKDGWASGNQGYALRCGANGSLSFNFSSSGTWREVTAPNVMTTGKWYHVAGTFDGANSKIFVNGIEVGNLAYSGTIAQGNYDLTIGRASYTGGGTRNFAGRIDEVKVWNTALPASSLQEYMCKKTTAAHPQYASLSGYWKLDNNGTVTDSSPNGNNGTVNNASQPTSGAPIGDESVFVYNAAPNISLGWAGTNPDSVNLSGNTSMNSVHLYRIDGPPNSLIYPNISPVETSHHYGFYTDSDVSFSLNATYYYNQSTLVTGNEVYANIAGAIDAAGLFNGQGWTLNQADTKFTKSFSNRSQFILGIVCPNTLFNTYTQQNLCTGDSVLLENTGNSTNFQWHNNQGAIAGATNNQFYANQTNDYYIVANSGICLDTTVSIAVVVNQNPTVLFGTLSSQFCDNEDEIAVVASTPFNGTYSGIGMTDSIFSPQTAGIGAYSLYYSYTDPATGCSGIDSTYVTVLEAPLTPTLTSNGLEMCIDSPQTGAVYQWYLDGMSIAGETGICYTASVNGDYYVLATTGSCFDESEITTVDFVSLTEVESIALTVYPNPTNNFITIESSSELERISLLNELGQVIHTTEVEGKEVNLDITEYEKGSYFLKIETEKGTSTKSFIKQ
ncbi:MAG: LamG-like jellyroll fold domain-containing protein [Lishizhenia sp.]